MSSADGRSARPKGSPGAPLALPGRGPMNYSAAADEGRAAARARMQSERK